MAKTPKPKTHVLAVVNAAGDVVHKAEVTVVGDPAEVMPLPEGFHMVLDADDAEVGGTYVDGEFVAPVPVETIDWENGPPDIGWPPKDEQLPEDQALEVWGANQPEPPPDPIELERIATQAEIDAGLKMQKMLLKTVGKKAPKAIVPVDD